jgi:hypothetical protein
MFTTVDTRAGYLEVIEAMAGLSPPLFVFGGIAEDALLDHEFSRPHSDIDVMVLRGELGRRLRQCEALGFDHFEAYYEPIPGRPSVLGGHRGGLNLEVGILDRDGRDRYLTVAAETGDLCNVYLPDDAFAYPVAWTEGRPIQTLSSLALYQIRAGLGVTGTFGGLCPKDIAAQRRLRAAFLADRAEEAPRPRFERLGCRS